MKSIRFNLFVIVSSLLLATHPLISQNTRFADHATEDYFCTTGIEIDSCSYEPLYTELYKWIDVPYRYAGTSFFGIDCSGLVKNIYKNVFNLALSGSANYIFSQVTPIKDINKLTEGDLLFFKIKKNQISHIGIYLFKGYFIHASVSKGVTVSHLGEPYYQRHFFSGGRIN